MFLQIIHTGFQAGEATFAVVCEGDIRQSYSVTLPSPAKYPLNRYPARMFLDGLHWYLENYLDAPFGIYRDEAYSVNETIKAWGRTIFNRLFTGNVQTFYQKARTVSLEKLQILIICDSPEIMSWPWEALYSDEDGFISQRCCVVRQLSKVGNPPVLSERTQNTLNILFIISRPFGDNDVGYYNLVKNVVNYVNDTNKPISIEVLRPPTFDRLRQVLREKPNYYHIVHFDGHGGYDTIEEDNNNYKYAAVEGKLVFETNDCTPDFIGSELLAQLLAEYKIPIMVLNACQSGMISNQAKDPFACVSASLLRAGIHTVVAMGYSLYVSGAKQFVPAFYERLFYDGDISEAMRAGRNAMFRYPKRACIVGELPLSDWIVPVLYQQISDAQKVLPKIDSLSASPKEDSLLPQEVLMYGDYGFIGREMYIHKLERAMLMQKQAGILIHGQAGMGKTTLVKGFLNWLRDTGGLLENVFWFSFQETHSTEYIINTLVEVMFGIDAVSEQYDSMFEKVVQELRTRPYILVWDNFESASGIDGTEVSPNLSEEDRLKLLLLLKKLRGGRTKVLITSRNPEKWLNIQSCYRIDELNGLYGEELWEYCNAIMSDLGLRYNRDDSAYREILKKLCGNPLAIRAILLRISELHANQILEELNTAFEGLEGDDSTKRIQAAYDVFGKDLTERFSPILQLIGLHEYYIHTDLLKEMLEKAEISVGENDITECFRILKNSGFCTYKEKNVFGLHPALRGFLLKRLSPADNVVNGFLNVMGLLAEALVKTPLHKAASLYKINIANLHYARLLAEKHLLDFYWMSLTQCLAYYANESRQFSQAHKLYTELANKASAIGDEKFHSVALHQLGTIAQKQRNFVDAEEYYKKALDIKIKNCDERGAAVTYHQMGILAQEQLDFISAEKWCKKSLELELKHGNERGAALTYHLLGIILEEKRDFVSAEEFYHKSLELENKCGDEQSAAVTCHQLGTLAEVQRNFVVAEEWCKKSLEIRMSLGDEHGSAVTCHLLGRIAEAQQHFKSAEEWYKKSLNIKMKYDDEHGAAITYHQLGLLAEKQQNYAAARDWLEKSLELKMRYGDEFSAASTYHHLGIIAQEQGDYIVAKDWYKKSLELKIKYDNELDAASTYHQLGIIAQEQMDFSTAEKWFEKSLAIKVKYDDEHGAAITCHHLGIIAGEQGIFTKAASFYLRAAEIFVRHNSPNNFLKVIHNYAVLLCSVPPSTGIQFRNMWLQHKLLEEYKDILKEMEDKLNAANN